MTAQQAKIERSSTTWILVANGQSAQVYRYHNNDKLTSIDHVRSPVLEVIPDMTFHGESLKDFHVGHDARGSKIGGNSAHNTCEPHLDIRDEVKQNMIIDIASKLKHACEINLFNNLVVVASPKVLGVLRRKMNANLRHCVIAEINKDFTSDTQEILLVHLHEVLSTMHLI